MNLSLSTLGRWHIYICSCICTSCGNPLLSSLVRPRKSAHASSGERASERVSVYVAVGREDGGLAKRPPVGGRRRTDGEVERDRGQERGTENYRRPPDEGGDGRRTPLHRSYIDEKCVVKAAVTALCS